MGCPILLHPKLCLLGIIEGLQLDRFQRTYLSETLLQAHKTITITWLSNDPLLCQDGRVWSRLHWSSRNYCTSKERFPLSLRRYGSPGSTNVASWFSTPPPFTANTLNFPTARFPSLCIWSRMNICNRSWGFWLQLLSLLHHTSLSAVAFFNLI